MNYSQISTMLTVLSSVQYQEIGLINQLNNFYGFDHNIFLIDALTDVHRFIEPASQPVAVPISLFRFNASDNQLDGMKAITKITSKSPLIIIGIEGVCWDCCTSFRQRLVEIHRMQRNLKICLFISQQFAGQEDLYEFFLWCWSRGIVNILVATLDQTILKRFSFDPFVNFRVITKTKDEDIDSSFSHQHVNYQLHTLRFPHIYRFSKEIINCLCKAMNASKSFTNHTSEIDIIPSFDLYPRPIGLKMYPIAMQTVLIVVPESLPYAGFSSYCRCMLSKNIFGWFCVVGVAISLLTIIRYISQKRITIFESTVDVVSLLVGEKTTMKYENLALAETSLIISLTFAGLLFVNVILSELLSFLTQPHSQPEINTIEDLYKSKIQIVVTPGYWEKEVVRLLNIQYYQLDWSSKIIAMNGDLVDKHIFSRNSSIAFISYNKQAQALFESQKRLGLRGYRIPSKVSVFVKMLQTFGANDNFPFPERIDEINHWLYHSGIYGKWDKDLIYSHSRMVQMDIEKNSQNEEDPRRIIIYGWIASALVFVSEILWKRFTLWLGTRHLHN